MKVYKVSFYVRVAVNTPEQRVCYFYAGDMEQVKVLLITQRDYFDRVFVDELEI